LSVVGKLIEGAIADVDIFNASREVYFLLIAPSGEKAELVADFINEYQFGLATPMHHEDGSSIQVTINMPVTQNVILSVSGFMTCLAAIYDLEFDGWSCVAQPRT
jgi:hypothetical protein